MTTKKEVRQALAKLARNADEFSELQALARKVVEAVNADVVSWEEIGTTEGMLAERWLI